VAAPQKGIEVDLKEIGCPYPAEDPRTSIWLDGYHKGHMTGLDRGAEVVRDAFDQVFSGDKPHGSHG